MKQDIYNLIKDNESLIYKIANKYSMYYNLEDLYQVGTIGIIKAYNNYDKNSDAKFSSYAYKYIMGEMIEYIRKDRNIIVSDEVFNLYKKYLKVKEMLFNKYEREASFSEICSFMEIGESTMLNIIEGVTFTKSINNDYEIYNDERENVDNKILLENELSLLNSFDKSIIDYRYYQGFTQSETADLLGVSQVKISREEKLILSRIKNNIA